MINSFFNDPVQQEKMLAYYLIGDECVDKEIKRMLGMNLPSALAGLSGSVCLGYNNNQFLSNETKKEINFVSEEIKEDL